MWPSYAAHIKAVLPCLLSFMRRWREKEKRTAGIEYIRAKLIRVDQGGFVDKTQDEILEGFKEKARRGGKL